VASKASARPHDGNAVAGNEPASGCGLPAHRTLPSVGCPKCLATCCSVSP
jgi:hypothetical protein